MRAVGRRAGAALAAALAVAGCSGGGGAADGGPPRDARADGDGGTGRAEPDPPAPAADPALGPCPDGWREVTAEDAPTRCEPWPEDGPAECSGARMHLPGEPGCAPVGAPCPDGDFADDLPDANVIFVRAGESGGDGSRAAPYGKIRDAVGRAGRGTTIAIAKGRYDEVVTLRAGVTLHGACAAETRIASTVASETAPVVDVRGGETVIRGLTVGPSPRPGIWVFDPGRETRLEGVIVEGTEFVGLVAAEGGRITGREVLVRDTEGRGSDGMLGRGLVVQSAGTVELERAAFVRNRDMAISAVGADVRLSLASSVVRDTRPQESDLGQGRGIDAEQGATVALRRVAVERTRELGLLLHGAGTTATLEDVVVHDTLSQERDGELGMGVAVEAGARASLDRVLVAANREFGIFVAGAGTEATLADVWVRDTDSPACLADRCAGAPDVGTGRGVSVQLGASLEADRLRLERNRTAGLFVGGEGARAVVQDLVVLDTRSREDDGRAGRGVGVETGGEAHLTRATIAGNRDTGLFVASSGSRAVLEDVTVRSTQPPACAPDACPPGDVDDPAGAAYGRGMSVQSGAALDGNRVLVDDNGELGVLAAQDATLTLANLEVRDTRSRTFDGLGGRGVSVQQAVTARITRARIAANRDTAVQASSDGTTLVLEDVVVQDTEGRDADGEGGRGLQAQLGARVEGTRLTFRNNRAFALNVSDEGTTARLEGLTVAGVRPRASDGRFGRALNVQLGAEATVRDTTVEGAHEVGIAVIEGARVSLEGVTVSDTRSQQSDGRFGRALNVQQGSVAEVSSSRFEDSRGVAVWVGGAGASATMSDVVVSGAHESSCGDDCPQGAGGIGVASYMGGDVRMQDFLVEDAVLCGVHVALASDLELAGGEIRDSAVGACVQIPGYDLDRLRSGVRYRDNDVNLDTVDLPVPAPLSS